MPRNDGMPRKKPPPPDEKPQRERFIEAAREAGVDETGEAFERAFAKIVPPKRRPVPDPSGTALAFAHYELTCPKCGEEGSYPLRELVVNDAALCSTCGSSIDLVEHRAGIREAAEIYAQIKVEPRR
jgi:predicted RNA-binding Zn-ribbon protein involved in translation (DUF1610 family)